MTMLTVYDDRPPHGRRDHSHDRNAIVEALAVSEVRLEHWRADAVLPDQASDDDILAAYAADIERLKTERGYRSCDVVRLTSNHPDKDALRAKFLAEHVHDDDEVRLFVEGAGLFYIHAGGAVYALECTAGDLVVLPAGTRHWFDTGARPRFTAIRLFTTPEGWVARFTGDGIADAIPWYDGAP